jgi:hypothetical protein
VTRKCIFCKGEGTLTKEHLWPRWLKKGLQLGPGVKARGIQVAGQIGEDKNWRDWNSELFESTSRRVCRTCNNGWMGNLEGLARPILVPMINGRETVLTPHDQRLVATWAYKTALTLGLAVQFDTDPIPASLYEGLFQSRVPPPACRIWIAGCHQDDRPCSRPGLRPFRLRNPDGTLDLYLPVDNEPYCPTRARMAPLAKIPNPAGGFGSMLQGLCFNLSVGTLAIHILLIQAPEWPDKLACQIPAAEGFIPVWPEKEAPLNFPGGKIIGWQDFNDLSWSVETWI